MRRYHPPGGLVFVTAMFPRIIHWPAERCQHLESSSGSIADDFGRRIKTFRTAITNGGDFHPRQPEPRVQMVQREEPASNYADTKSSVLRHRALLLGQGLTHHNVRVEIVLRARFSSGCAIFGLPSRGRSLSIFDGIGGNISSCETTIEDAAKAIYLLGKNPESDNQIWHLPTAPAIPGKQFIEIAARVYKVKPKYFSIKKYMLWLIGLFQKVVMGTVEMYYQYDHDYIFDSSKFEKAFNFKPTSYEDGITEVSKTLYKPA